MACRSVADRLDSSPPGFACLCNPTPPIPARRCAKQPGIRQPQANAARSSHRQRCRWLNACHMTHGFRTRRLSATFGAIASMSPAPSTTRRSCSDCTRCAQPPDSHTPAGGAWRIRTAISSDDGNRLINLLSKLTCIETPHWTLIADAAVASRNGATGPHATDQATNRIVDSDS